jgi:hypothetical protein
MLPRNIGTVLDDDFPDDGVKLCDAAFKTKTKTKESKYVLYENQTENSFSKSKNSYGKSGYL